MSDLASEQGGSNEQQIAFLTRQLEARTAQVVVLRGAVFGVVDRCEAAFRELEMDGPDERMGEVWFDAYTICKAALSDGEQAGELLRRTIGFLGIMAADPASVVLRTEAKGLAEEWRALVGERTQSREVLR